ncbi:adenine-specific DNA methylase [Aequorivita sublithincola DSM 14238]|uniref:site-specific DNA-methyltransferase (adenine-specific) n=1 Tax=Aequorivita sublithincola (strain DSM 14238 / LMG 21431 / ACAM 643 / 9-3) TaxID=746697 RepID=I3YUL4_AEQSU|nr:DNA adenine methylase [Aequorivita sublithincola]AFL80682.1 adenine-specific DNA methylase [Aequorivita sublithincola DSM 14238]
MNYIGSKHKLSSFIFETVTEICGNNLSSKVFCDLFAGTGIVGRNFKTHVKQVISNDVEYYSYVLNRNYIGNHTAFDYEDFIDELNALKGKKGFIFQNYSECGNAERNYFTSENGQKIDAVRIQIEEWKNTSKITEDQYFFLLASLLESADKFANTASVYGAYLKHIKASAAKKLIVKPAIFQQTENSHQVFQYDSNALINKIEGDILYLDPPYNARQYGANYHLLNTMAKYDTFVPKGKTGLRDYYKSDWCRTGEVLKSFEELIENAQFKYIFLSYNNEGLMSQKDVQKVMERFGKYSLKTKKYQRFKADKTENRNHKASETFEYLHILEKR